MPQTQLHHHSSSTNSNNLPSSCSSVKNPPQPIQKTSDADKLVLLAMQQNKENSIINVKLEENSNEMPKIRKKICRKMLKIFHDEFNLDRKDAKRLTLQLETRFNLLFSFKSEKYIESIKKFFINLRVTFFLLMKIETRV
jgi:hypothetical protein